MSKSPQIDTDKMQATMRVALAKTKEAIQECRERVEKAGEEHPIKPEDESTNDEND